MDVIWVTRAQYLDHYRVRVVFNDGSCGTVDLASLVMENKLFSELRDVEVFCSFKVDGWTLTWLDGRIDISPEYLYEHLEREHCDTDVAAEPDMDWRSE